MAEKKKGLGLPETKGQFQAIGIITGTEKDSFYKEQTIKTNKPFRMVNFGVQFDKNATMYLSLTGMEQDNVYFSKTETDEATKKKTTLVESTPWKDRFKFSKEGFKVIGVNLGLSKIKNEKGKEVNDKKSLSQYDACKEIGDNLLDGMSVFVKGNIEHSTYEEKRQTRFVPTQISLCRPIDFEADDFQTKTDFQQTIVYTGITQNKEKSKFVITAKIITFNSVEDAEYVIVNSELASIFRKNMKPYQALKVWGYISSEKNTEEVTNDDCWGEANEMEKINAPTVREMIITGADPKSLEKEIYTEKAIEEAVTKMNASKQANKEYGGNSDTQWGSVGISEDFDDEDSAW